ncbi:acyl-CoA dehydrogenase [Purpureocillium lavendulum]|uniref:Acyl-CoA dehydrogenase n=1 Tax=Purpureocillium lavendulum TaxID=1247861 RepID=A0AB34FM27_9HYPO|nr:acyl-CoA dehydrogenase [Purpureocillium lavendulum]
MPNRRTRRPVRLTDVVFLAGAASGTVFTLSNFQMLSSGSVPLGCILAYNTPIRGCRIRDFTEKTCSDECRDSLNEVQSNVQTSCDQISVASGTLLYKAQKGTLTDSLCRPEDEEPSSTVAPTPTAPQTTLKSFTIIPSESTTSPESTSEVSTISSIPSTSEPESTSSSVFTSSVRSTVKPNTSSTTLVSTPIGKSAPTSTSTSSTSTTQGPRQTIPPGSGGGSPFDFVSAGSRAVPFGAMLYVSTAFCVVALLAA